MRDIATMLLVGGAVVGAAYMIARRGSGAQQAAQLPSSLPADIARYGLTNYNRSGSADQVLTWV